MDFVWIHFTYQAYLFKQQYIYFMSERQTDMPHMPHDWDWEWNVLKTFKNIVRLDNMKYAACSC